MKENTYTEQQYEYLQVRVHTDTRESDIDHYIAQHTRAGWTYVRDVHRRHEFALEFRRPLKQEST